MRWLKIVLRECKGCTGLPEKHYIPSDWKGREFTVGEGRVAWFPAGTNNGNPLQLDCQASNIATVVERAYAVHRRRMKLYPMHRRRRPR